MFNLPLSLFFGSSWVHYEKNPGGNPGYAKGFWISEGENLKYWSKWGCGVRRDWHSGAFKIPEIVIVADNIFEKKKNK